MDIKLPVVDSDRGKTSCIFEYICVTLSNYHLPELVLLSLRQKTSENMSRVLVTLKAYLALTPDFASTIR